MSFQVDPEEQREMYLRMFVDNYNPPNQIDKQQQLNRDLSDNTFNNRDNGGATLNQNYNGGSSNDYSSLNERLEESSEPSLNEVDFQLTVTNKGQSFKKKLQEPINAGATVKSQKSVKFYEDRDEDEEEEKGVIKRRDINKIAQEIIYEKVTSIKDDLQELYDKNQRVKEEIDEAYSCENPKVLEVILEHILLHWDDIMEVLIDDILEEEVLELNNIEAQKTQRENEDRGKKQRDTKLADKSLYGKYHDYRSVDMRDIFSIFEDYKQVETSIRNRL